MKDQSISLIHIWEETLKNAGLAASDIQRAKGLAARQDDLEVEITPGAITAEISSGRRTQYDVNLSLTPINQKQWDSFIDHITEHANYLEAFIAGDNNLSICHALLASPIEFNDKSDGLEIDCSCSMPKKVCNHVLAVIGQLDEVFRQEPFEYILFRGKTKKEITSELTNTDYQPIARTAGIEQLQAQTLELPEDLGRNKKCKLIKKWRSDPLPNSPFSQEDLLEIANDAVVRAQAIQKKA